MTSVRVMIRLATDGQWSAVGQAVVEMDPDTGMTLLRLDLSAMAPRLYLPLADLLLATPPSLAPSLGPNTPVAGHA